MPVVQLEINSNIPIISVYKIYNDGERGIERIDWAACVASAWHCWQPESVWKMFGIMDVDLSFLSVGCETE